MKLEFSRMELIVRDLMECGKSGAQIGEDLKVCSGTVYRVIGRIREKEKARRVMGLISGDDFEEYTLP